MRSRPLEPLLFIALRHPFVARARWRLWGLTVQNVPRLSGNTTAQPSRAKQTRILHPEASESSPPPRAPRAARRLDGGPLPPHPCFSSSSHRRRTAVTALSPFLF